MTTTTKKSPAVITSNGERIPLLLQDDGNYMTDGEHAVEYTATHVDLDDGKGARPLPDGPRLIPVDARAKFHAPGSLKSLIHGLGGPLALTGAVVSTKDRTPPIFTDDPDGDLTIEIDDWNSRVSPGCAIDFPRCDESAPLTPAEALEVGERMVAWARKNGAGS